MRRAQTLIEVAVVCAIAGLALGLALLATSHVRERSSRSCCEHNLRQLIVAVHHHQAQHGFLPPYASGSGKEIYGGWMVHLLPFTEQHALHGVIAGSPSDGVFSAQAQNTTHAVLLCPSEASASDRRDRTNYVANWFALTDGTGFFRPVRRLTDLTDGLSNVVLFAEAFAECDNLPRLALVTPQYHNFTVTPQGLASDDPRYAPADYTMFQVRPPVCDNWRAQTSHQVMNVACADGSVRAIDAHIAATLWKQLLKPQDGGPLTTTW